MNIPTAFLGTLGTQEMVLIFLILLLLFGAKKLPQLARGVGKSVGEFRKAREEFEDEIKKGADEADKAEEEIATKKPEGTESRDS